MGMCVWGGRGGRQVYACESNLWWRQLLLSWNWHRGKATLPDRVTCPQKRQGKDQVCPYVDWCSGGWGWEWLVDSYVKDRMLLILIQCMNFNLPLVWFFPFSIQFSFSSYRPPTGIYIPLESSVSQFAFPKPPAYLHLLPPFVLLGPCFFCHSLPTTFWAVELKYDVKWVQPVSSAVCSYHQHHKIHLFWRQLSHF